MTDRPAPPCPGVAVLGAGAWGMNQVRVFAELGALRVVCDEDPERLVEVRSVHPSVATTPSPEEVVSNPDVDAVIIATPAVTHGPLARLVLEHGKDVLVEKPMALTVEEADELRAQAERTDRILAVGHVMEHHPAVRELRRLVDEGVLGRVRYLYSNRLNFGRIRTEENVLWSFAPHDVAIMLRLLGHSPTGLACHGEWYLSRDVADTTLTSMTFARDVRAHIFVSWLHPFKEQRFVVVGDRRMVVFDDTAPWIEKLIAYEHGVDWAKGQIPVARKAAGEPLPVEEAEPLRVQAEDFLDAVRAHRPPLCDAASGVAVLQVLKAAQRSMESDGAPVDLGAPQDVPIHPTTRP